MKIRYLAVAALAVVLLSGCISVKVERDCKCDQKEGKESGEREEGDEDHDAKATRHEQKESAERDDEREGRDSKAQLLAKAKISEADARRTAQARVPNGTIKEAELEMEKGKLQWSFDIATPNSKDITEVNINAISGEVISVAKEKPDDQAKERDEDEKKEEQEKE